MPNEKYSEKIKQVQIALEELAEKASQRSGFEQRTSKLSGKRFAQTMIVGCLEKPEVSLNELVQVSADLNVEISESGLNQRIDWEAVELLRELLAEIVQQLHTKGSISSGVLAQFKGLYIVDSTQIGLPESLQDIFGGVGGDGSKASAKVYLQYEYLSGDIHALDMTDGRSPDQKYRQHIDSAESGSLHLFDLGFFKQEYLAELQGAGAYFISRLQSQCALYWQPDDAAGFDLVSFLRSIDTDQCELQAYLGRTARLFVRVLCQRLPPETVAERRRKAKAKMRREKKTPSQRYLQMLEWAIFITNVPADRLSFEQVLLVYRVRWQVELIFKLWKSQARLAAIGNWRPERVLCQVFARLAGLVLFHWLLAPFRLLPDAELSLDKAFHVFQRHLPAFAQALASHWHLLSPILVRLERDFLRFARKTSRKKSPSTFQRLCLAGA